jgi:hypothetical protein
LVLEAWRLELVAYLLGAYLTRQAIPACFLGMQQEACYGPPGTMAASHLREVSIPEYIYFF